MKSFIGRYQHGPDDIRIITMENGWLYSRRGSGEKYKLVAMGDNRFFFDDEPQIQLQFKTEKGLRVQYRYMMDNVAQRIN